MVIGDMSGGPGAEFHHFAGVGKMVIRFISRLFTGSDRPFDGILDTPPLPIPLQFDIALTRP